MRKEIWKRVRPWCISGQCFRGFGLSDEVNGRRFVHTYQTGVKSALSQHIEMSGWLTGVEEIPGDVGFVAGVNAVLPKIPPVEGKHHGEIAARTGSANGENGVGKIVPAPGYA